MKRVGKNKKERAMTEKNRNNSQQVNVHSAEWIYKRYRSRIRKRERDKKNKKKYERMKKMPNAKRNIDRRKNQHWPEVTGEVECLLVDSPSNDIDKKKNGLEK